MRIVFMGTGDIALPTLSWLLREDTPGQVEAVFTQPDKPVGRKQELTAPAPKRLAEAQQVPVLQPISLRKSLHDLEALEAIHPDLIIVIAYGQILPQRVLDCPSVACVNLHASLLPKYRGASPIQAAIREGDLITGITLMHVVPQVDAGPMLSTIEIPISDTDTGGTLHDKLAQLGPALLERDLEPLAQSSIKAIDQEESEATYAPKLGRDDGKLDLHEPAEQLERMIRAYDPWPGTYLDLEVSGKTRKLKVFPPTSIVADSPGAPGELGASASGLVLACGDGRGLLCHGDLQFEGRRRLPAVECLRGLDQQALAIRAI
ncbi:MAG: methionyl-tRNA formyltransferase [Verrucomicrobiota bacterium]